MENFEYSRSFSTESEEAENFDSDERECMKDLIDKYEDYLKNNPRLVLPFAPELFEKTIEDCERVAKEFSGKIKAKVDYSFYTATMKPFEICVKNYDFDNNPLAVMSSFTLIGPRYTGANSDLLNGVLRGEWGFQGMVLTDWYGSYGYQLTMDSVLNGNDIMLGFGSNVRTDIENKDSATMVKALRQASKNIMFTVVRSGNYTINFPLQRNITFKSHGPLGIQIAAHGIATIAVFLVMNLFTCVWNPVTEALITNAALRNTLQSIVTAVVTGGVAMIIIFAVDNKIFAPEFGKK